MVRQSHAGRHNITRGDTVSKRKIYNFEKLGVGDSIHIPWDGAEFLPPFRWGLNYRRVKSACDKYRIRNAPEKRFQIRAEGTTLKGGIRVAYLGVGVKR